MIKSPYSMIELLIASAGINESRFSQKKLRELKKELKPIVPKNRAEFNRQAAVFHGISAEVLVNSRNYEKLIDEYREHFLDVCIQKFARKFKLTKKQVWAIIVVGLGLLDK